MASQSPINHLISRESTMDIGVGEGGRSAPQFWPRRGSWEEKKKRKLRNARRRKKKEEERKEKEERK